MIFQLNEISWIYPEIGVLISFPNQYDMQLDQKLLCFYGTSLLYGLGHGAGWYQYLSVLEA